MNISDAFKNGKAVVPFVTCGDPDMDTTAKVVTAAAEAGADMILLGIPFSDPTAEGVVVQDANIRALAGGITTDKIFDYLEKFKGTVNIPLVFLTYANVVFSYGDDKFMSRCKDVGISGVILHDLPYEEKDEFTEASAKYGIDLVSLVATASDDRAKAIAEIAEGFLYIVPSLESMDKEEDIKHIYSVIRSKSEIPCVAGFDESDISLMAKTASVSDGVVIESKIVKLVAKYGKDAPAYVSDYIKLVKAGL